MRLLIKDFCRYVTSPKVYRDYYECFCGRRFVAQRTLVKSGKLKSCGCLYFGKTPVKHGLSKNKEYAVWSSMKTRCYNNKSPKYLIYGGRGIRVCDRWLESFTNFYADMGPRPSNKHSLDRIDNNGNYEPSNCRWATASQQNKNRRPYKVINRYNNLLRPN